MSDADTRKNTVPTAKERFEMLTLEHLGALYRHAVWLTRNSTAAEDIVQEAYLKAYRAFGSYRQGSNIKAWLFKILRNTFISEYRKRKNHPEIRVPEDDPDFTTFYGAVKHAHLRGCGELSEKDLTDAAKLERFLGDEVMQALELLSDEYREAIFLCDIQHLSYQEMAEVLDIPIGTVRSRLARARNLLQKALWHYAQDKGLWRRS